MLGVSLFILFIKPWSSMGYRSSCVVYKSKPLHSSRKPSFLLRSHDPESSEAKEDGGSEEVFHEKTNDAILLRMNLSFPSSNRDASKMALNAVTTYTKSFPFAAVLPVQPLTYLPEGDQAVKVTFLRKKTDEKGSTDGGILFQYQLESQDSYEEPFHGHQRQRIRLEAKRISEGQTISKLFSEKQIILAFVKSIDEARGKQILEEGGNVEVDSVFHLWM